MNQTEFDMIRAAIKAAWPGYMVMNDKYSIRFWYSMLGHLELNVAENAIQQLAATSKYPPQISDILQKAAEMNGAVLEDPGEAWQLVMSAVRNYGSYRQCRQVAIALLELLDTCSKLIGEIAKFFTE